MNRNETRSDLELIEACQLDPSGSSLPFQELMRRHHRLIYKTINPFLRHSPRYRREDLERELHGSAVAGFWDAVRTFRPGAGTFPAWAQLVMRRWVHQEVRRLEFPWLSKTEFETRPHWSGLPVEEAARELRKPVAEVLRLLNPPRLVPIHPDPGQDTPAMDIPDRSLDPAQRAVVYRYARALLEAALQAGVQVDGFPDDEVQAMVAQLSHPSVLARVVRREA